MLVALVDLGLVGPFLGLSIGSLAVASIVASLALLSLTPQGEAQRPSRGRKELVWFLVWGAAFLLWGSASGHGGPAPEGGTTGYTHGGILRYLTVTSYQPGAGGAWSHDLSIHPWALVGTVALSAGLLVVVSVVARVRRISA